MPDLISTRTKLRFKSLKIKGYTVLPQAISVLNIYETITREGITGEISVNDWQGLAELGYIFAGDDIEIQLASEDRPLLNLKLKIYATYDNQHGHDYTYKTNNFMFCSPWMLEGLTRQISKPYKDKFIHEIVQDLLEECGATIGYIEPTKQKLENFVTPLWTAVHSIRHLMTYAINEKGIGGYLLWTDLATGKTNFATLDWLYKGSYGTSTRFTELPGNPQYEGAIKYATIEQNWDMIQYGLVGMGKIRNYSLWLDKKKVVETEDDIKKWGSTVTHLANKFPVDQKLLDKKYWMNSFCALYPKKAQSVSSQEELDMYVKGEQSARYAYMASDIMKINIQTVGKSDRRVGQLALFDLQSQNEPNAQTGNLQFKGLFLIRDIRHEISCIDAEYTQYVALCNDGYYKFENSNLISWSK